MTINYDRVADAVYMKVADSSVSKTVPVNERFNVDVDAHGNTVGFEILEASSQEGLINALEKSVMNGVPVHITEGTPVAA